MKNIITSIAIAGCAALTTNYSIAESTDDGNVYAGVQYGIGDFSASGVSVDYSPDIILLRFGMRNDYFALETRVGSGVKSVTESIPGVAGNVDLSIGSLIGAYGVLHANFSESSSVYGLVGVTRIEASLRETTAGITETDRDNGLSIGAGIDIGVWEDVKLNIEYTSYIIDSDFNLNSIGLGIVFGY